MLRGGREFASRGDYQTFLKKLMAGRNANRKGDFSTTAGTYRPLAWWSVFIVSAREGPWASRNMSSAIRPLMVG
jgi:hypothetical protein